MTTTHHDHSLAAIVGYEVRQTIVAAKVLGLDGPIIGVAAPHAYEDALALAERRRIPGGQSWAVVDSVYACGCTDRDF